MNTWVEYFKYEDRRNNTHAQMKEQAKWTEPTDVMRRFFDKPEDARQFAKRMGDQGYHATVKTDGAGMGHFDRFKC